MLSKEGLDAEIAIAYWLAHVGYHVRKSSWYEDTRLDIDLWVRGHQFRDWVSVSVKSQAVGIVYGDVYFELTNTRCPGGISWFNYGKAQYYLILRDTRFIPRYRKSIQAPTNYTPRFALVSKQRMTTYVEAYGWDKVRSQSAEGRSREQGHRAECGFVKANKVLRKDDITLLPEGWYDTIKEVMEKLDVY